MTLFTRPRRFGKTLNMSMLFHFFDISQDTTEIFEGNVDKESNDYYDFYLKYQLLRERKANSSLLMDALFTITKSVFSYYKIKPLLLIDEYGQPLISSHQHNYRETFSVFYSNFLGNALKGNPNLGRAVLTGIQRVANESIFSKLNNLDVFTVLDYRFSEFFGLTKQETTAALSAYHLTLTDEINDFYDGYTFGNQEVYNSWSIINYIDKRIVKSYWLNTSTNALIREAILKAPGSFNKSFEQLILNGEITKYVNLEASFIELKEDATLWGLLVNAGYLTFTRKYGEKVLTLKIPNNEVKGEFRKIVSSYAHLGSSSLDNKNSCKPKNEICINRRNKPKNLL